MKSYMRDWIADLCATRKQSGLIETGVTGLRSVYNTGWFGLTSRYALGTNIYTREWDVLLVLDGCRVDALRAVASEYEWLGPIDSIWSVGSASHEWTSKTFTEDHKPEIADTALITANPFAKKVFDDENYPPHSYSIPIDISNWSTVASEDFAYTEWCFQQIHGYEDLFPTQPARHMTDRGIIASRNLDVDHLILHYFQPHRPFIYDAVNTNKLSEVDDKPYEARKRGAISRRDLWERYLKNLRYVLNDVELLLSNIDAKRVVITADHGELMGELNQYGHPEGVPHPALKKVPWAITSATNQETYEPPDDVSWEDDYDPEQQLRELGYK